MSSEMVVVCCSITILAPDYSSALFRRLPYPMCLYIGDATQRSHDLEGGPKAGSFRLAVTFPAYYSSSSEPRASMQFSSKESSVRYSFCRHVSHGSDILW
ncbi:hypothetical protein ACLOJK_027953 [Asimina triloba]